MSMRRYGPASSVSLEREDAVECLLAPHHAQRLDSLIAETGLAVEPSLGAILAQ